MSRYVVKVGDLYVGGFATWLGGVYALNLLATPPPRGTQASGTDRAANDLIASKLIAVDVPARVVRLRKKGAKR